MRGLHRLRSARTIAAGHAFVQNLRRGDYELAADEATRDRVRVAFDELAHCAVWKGGLPDAPAWLAEHGWHTELHDRASLAARYKRASRTNPLTGAFMTAVRTQT